MKLATKTNAGFPALLSDWLTPSKFFGRDFFDMDPDLFQTRLGVNVPSVNVKENPKDYVLEVAAPGLERKDFSIEVDNHILSISAAKEEEKKEENGYTRREYSFNSFCRTFSLPENVKEGNIDAKYDNGILKIVIPKTKETPVSPAHKVPVS